MNTSVMSLSPIERTSWRCVPSPQSKSTRSPPRRTSRAGRPRRAVGAEPAVPAKNSERSIAARSVFAVCLALSLVVALASAPAAARRPVPGVVADLPLNGADYARLHESGVKVVRLFMFTHAYNDAGFRDAVGRLDALGIRPLFVVVGDPAAPPLDGGGVDAYASFVAARAAEFRGRIAGWEIWNEEDAQAWWAPAPPVDGTARRPARGGDPRRPDRQRLPVPGRRLPPRRSRRVRRGRRPHRHRLQPRR